MNPHAVRTGSKTRRPPRKKKRPAPSAAEVLVTCCILLVSLAIISCLLFYFHPFSLADIRNFASSASTQVQEWGREYIFTKLDGQTDNQEEASDFAGEPQETPAHIPVTTDIGDVADFTAEPVFPAQEDSVYYCFLDTAIGPMLYYNQGDLRWKSYLYGGSDPMSKYGCGPTCVSMIINSFSDVSVTPVEIADWSAQNGCFAAGGGSYHDLIPKSLSAFGLQVDSITNRTTEYAAQLLQTNHILVALMGKGSLTNNGHFIIIAKLTPSGNVYIADPANYENSTKEWNLQQLMDELKQSYDSGGPLWAVSLNKENKAANAS